MNLRYDDGELFSDVLEFHTLEIPKVTERSDGSKKWEWAKFFSSETEEEFIVCAENNEEIKKAVIKLRELSEDERNFMIAERIEKDRRDRIAEVALGEQRGEARGRAEGRAEGIEQTQLQTATVMLRKKFPVEDISEITGLSKEQIDSIQIEQ